MSARRTAPAAERNRQPILEVLRTVLPSAGVVLEIASGTGQHVAHFAAALPALQFQPSDPDPEALESVAEWTAGLPNVNPPIELDVTREPWPIDAADAIVCINMIHISPWAATQSLVRGGARILPHGGLLFLYGPYRVGGAHTATSNAAFDADLKARNPAWGVRDLEAVMAEADAAGFDFVSRHDMPANNLSVVFRRR